MKILVDEMPKTAADCPYSEYWERFGKGGYRCGKESIGCLQGEDNQKYYCPIFTDISPAIHAEWKSIGVDVYCTHCGKPHKYKSEGCPHCGAIMDKR